MKKFINSLICMGLLTGSMASALMSPVRVAKCIANAEKNHCTAEERRQTKTWVASASITAIIALLALIGFAVGPKGAEKIKQQQTKGDMSEGIEAYVSERQLIDQSIYNAVVELAKLRESLKKDPTNASIQNEITAWEEKKNAWTIEKDRINAEISRLTALKRTVGRN